MSLLNFVPYPSLDGYGQCNYFKERGKKTIDIAKKKDIVCEFKNSDVLPKTYSLIKQQHKSCRRIAANDADSVEKFRISKKT